MVDATARFVELMQQSDPDMPLDEPAALIAAHAHPELDVGAVLAALDTLAKESAADDADGLAHFLFVERGFAGNTVDYGDPRNSYLDDVLDRRLGIPISLSVLMMEVGRRRVIGVTGVGMPGHFLVRGPDPDAWFDPFHGGRRLDEPGCRVLFEEVRGGDVEFRPEYLEPTPPAAIVGRMLTNLQHSLMRRDPSAATWVLRLRLRVPGVPPAERATLAMLLGRLGQFAEAANELEAVALTLDGEAAERAARQAAALRARGN